MIDIQAAATRKIGPLPAFAWGGIVGGGILAWRILHGGSASGSSPYGQVIGGTGNINFEDGAGGGGGGGTGGVTDDGSVPTTVVPNPTPSPWVGSHLGEPVWTPYSAPTTDERSTTLTLRRIGSATR